MTRSLKPLPVTDREELLSALKRLSERDQRLIELRYGLKGARLHSRAEIGRLFGLSRERIRQLENRALDVLGDPAAGTRNAADRRRRGVKSPAPSTQSFLRCWTLVLLRLRPSHVYGLQKRMAELGLPTPFYRTLQALERDGLLTSNWEDGRGAGPRRRVYDLTPLGVQKMHTHVAELSNVAKTLEVFLADE